MTLIQPCVSTAAKNSTTVTQTARKPTLRDITNKTPFPVKIAVSKAVRGEGPSKAGAIKPSKLHLAPAQPTASSLPVELKTPSPSVRRRARLLVHDEDDYALGMEQALEQDNQVEVDPAEEEMNEDNVPDIEHMPPTTAYRRLSFFE